MNINEYKKLELKARHRNSNSILEAFSPITFQESGYPIFIDSDDELWRYCDVMQEGRCKDNLDFLGGLSKSEFDLCKKTSNQIIDYSNRLGHKVNGKNIVTRAIIAKRILGKVIPSDEKLTIFEVGAGSGALGAMLVNSGHKYYSMDVTQAFYLHQNNFFSYIHGDNFSEWATNPGVNKKNNHIPWWIITDYNYVLPSCNVVFCNHAMNEMHPRSFRFTFKRLIESMDNYSTKYILAESLGGGKASKFDIIMYLKTLGADLIHFHDNIAVFKISPSVEQSHNNTAIAKINRLTPSFFKKLIPPSLKKQIISYNSTNYNFDKQYKLLTDINKPAGKSVGVMTVIDYYNDLFEDGRTSDEVFTDYIKFKNKFF